MNQQEVLPSKEQIDAALEANQHLVDKRDALKRLLAMDDFNKVFGKEEMEKEVLRISTHLAIPERKAYTVDMLTAISMFQMSIHQIIRMGDQAEDEITQIMEAVSGPADETKQ